MNARPNHAHQLGLDFLQSAGRKRFEEKPNSMTFFNTFGGGEGLSISVGSMEASTLLFLSGGAEETIQYVSQRYIRMGEYGPGIMSALEIKIDLLNGQVLTTHSRMSQGYKDEPHNYPLLIELNKTLGGYLEDIPELKKLLKALRRSNSKALARFDFAEWSLLRQEDSFPFLPQQDNYSD